MMRNGTLSAALILGFMAAPSLAQFSSTCAGAAAAAPIAPGSYAYDTTGLTPNSFGDGEYCHDPLGLWFKYTAPVAQALVIDNCGSPDTSSYSFCGKSSCGGDFIFDTDYVFPDPGNWFEYPCPNNPGFYVRAVVRLAAGQTILVRIGAGSEVAAWVNLSTVDATPNDACASATDVIPGSYPFNTEAATFDAADVPDNSCSTDQPDLWYRFTPTVTGVCLAKVCGTQLPDSMVIAATTGCGPSASVLACNQFVQYNACDNPGLRIPVTAGVPVYLRLSGGFGERLFRGTLELGAVVPTPANDACAAASPAATGSYPFNLTAASTDGSTSCYSQTNSDVWFDYQAPATGLVAINAFGDDGTTPLAFYYALSVSASCGGPEIACKFSSVDDGILHVVPPAQPLVFSATAGQHYRIRIAGVDGAVGSGQLVITVPESPIANDSCAGATPVTDGLVTIDNTLATTDPLPWPCGPIGSGVWFANTDAPVKDVWLQYTPTATGVAEITDCGFSSIRSALAAYQSCGVASSAVACNVLTPCLGGRMVFPVTTGVPVYIRIGSQYNRYGNQNLMISYQDTALPNQSCATAQEIGEGTNSYDTRLAVSTGAALCESPRVSAGGELWFKYTAPNSGYARFRDIRSQNPAVGPHELSIYSSCGSVLVCPNNFDQYRNVPMSEGQTVYLRILDGAVVNYRLGYENVGPGSIEVIDPVPGPSNDTCSTAINALPNVDYPFDTTLAQEALAPITRASDLTTCGLGNPTPDIWYSFTVPGATTQLSEVVFGVCDPDPAPNHSISVYDACGGTQLDCGATFPLNDARIGDGCATFPLAARSPVTLYLIGGSTVKVQVYANAPNDYGPGVFRITSAPVTAWREHPHGEASDLPASAQRVAGSGPVDRIVGFLDHPSDVDMYRIRICNPAAFSATTVDSTMLNTALYLFDASGHGVVGNDNDPATGVPQSRITSAHIPAAGEYFLAVSLRGRLPVDAANAPLWNDSPANAERTPDGPGAANAIAGWTGDAGAGLGYAVRLSGVCFVCAADFNASGSLSVQDIFDFLNAWFAGSPSADFNGNGLAVQDIFDFLNAWFNGCP